MASPAWYAGFLTAFGPLGRLHRLCSLSDADLAARGLDRAGLRRSYVAGIGGF